MKLLRSNPGSFVSLVPSALPGHLYFSRETAKDTLLKAASIYPRIYQLELLQSLFHLWSFFFFPVFWSFCSYHILRCVQRIVFTCGDYKGHFLKTQILYSCLFSRFLFFSPSSSYDYLHLLPRLWMTEQVCWSLRTLFEGCELFWKPLL